MVLIEAKLTGFVGFCPTSLVSSSLSEKVMMYPVELLVLTLILKLPVLSELLMLIVKSLVERSRDRVDGAGVACAGCIKKLRSKIKLRNRGPKINKIFFFINKQLSGFTKPGKLLLFLILFYFTIRTKKVAQEEKSLDRKSRDKFGANAP